VREQAGKRGIRDAGPSLLVLSAALPLALALVSCRADGDPAPAPAPGDGALGEQVQMQFAGAGLPFQGLGASLAQGLAAAIEDGEDELAGELAARLEPLAATPEEHAFVASCRRILAGRALQAAIRIELVLDDAAEPAPAPPRIWLEVVQTTDAPLTLHLPPADVEHLRTWITPEGIESRALGVRPVSGLERLLLPPGVARRIEVGPRGAAVPGALAVRDAWEVAFRSGDVERGDELLPLRGLYGARLERTTLAPGLAVGLTGGLAAEDPAAELAAALGDPARELQELLVLAVSVPAEARDTTLAALAPEVERLARETPERLRTVAPVLRWIARADEPGADPEAWAAWFRARETRRSERTDADGDPRLDLPARP
jgi:hypothetical protein